MSLAGAVAERVGVVSAARRRRNELIEGDSETVAALRGAVWCGVARRRGVVRWFGAGGAAAVVAVAVVAVVVTRVGWTTVGRGVGLGVATCREGAGSGRSVGAGSGEGVWAGAVIGDVTTKMQSNADHPANRTE